MTVLGEHGSSSGNDSGARTDLDAFGRAPHSPDNRRPGRRRGARVRARAFSVRSRRERRRAWAVDALRLPDPLLTAPMAIADAPAEGHTDTEDATRTRTAAAKNAPAQPRRPQNDPNDTADWQGGSVHAIDLSDSPRLIVRREPPTSTPTPAPDFSPGFFPAVANLSAAAPVDIPSLRAPSAAPESPTAPGHPSTPQGPATPESPTALHGPAVPAPRDPLDSSVGSALDEAAGLRPGSGSTRAPLFSSGRDQLPDPVQLATEPSRLPEALLATVLAIVAGLAAWGTAAPREAWIALAALPAVGLVALLLPGGTWARVIRAGALLAAAATLPVLAPSLTPVTLVVALATTALYPMLVAPVAGRVIILLAIGCLIAPLVTAALTDGPADFFRLLLAADGDPTTAIRLALGSGILVVALIGGSTLAARRTLTRTASLAVTRERTARAATARLGAAATSDLATGLPNREALLRALTIALTDGDRRRHPSAAPLTGQGHAGTGQEQGANGRVGLVQIDIERFAELADSLGAAVADEVAEQIADRLRTRYPAPAFLARVSRHQFALMLPDATHDECAGLAREVTALMTAAVDVTEQGLSVTCAMGAALAGPGLRTADELLQAADEAARAAQRSGRSRWVMFDQAVRAHALSQATLEIELRDAVRRGAIEVAFQPILGFGSRSGTDDAEAVDDRIVGVEALARWTRADATVIEPQRFIPMADELGLGVELGMQVIRQALGALTIWRHEGIDIDQVWVNLAPSQLDDPEFAHEVAAQLAIRGLPATSLVLEISAGRLSESEQCLSTLGMLRSLGIAVALDDFGRNGTSLSALRRLPISAVKIDPSLATELGRQDAVPRAVTQLCRTLGLRVVIEGAETLIQLHGAREIQADAVQGFAVARPMSAEDVTNLLTLRLPRDFRLR